jgi:hypothetical protein
MHRCDHCEGSAELSYECNYCGGRYCPDHRLPEGHECDGVEFLSGSERWFRDTTSGEVVTSRSEIEPPEPMDPDYTVGTTPSPAFESAPEVELKSDDDGDREQHHNVVLRLVRRLLGR